MVVDGGSEENAGGRPAAGPLRAGVSMGGQRQDNDAQTEQIIGAAIEVHRHLGPGLLESIYVDALCHELGLRSVPFERQKPIEIKYKGVVLRGQKVDLLVLQEVIVEVKSVPKDPPHVLAQILSYLKGAGLRRGLIINFGHGRLVDGIQRVSALEPEA